MLDRSLTDTPVVVDALTWKMRHLYVSDKILLAYVQDQVLWVKRPMPDYSIEEYPEITDEIIATGFSLDFVRLGDADKTYAVAYAMSGVRKFIRYLDDFLLVDSDDNGYWYRSAVPMDPDEMAILNALRSQLQEDEAAATQGEDATQQST